jgi:hypothetical protein
MLRPGPHDLVPTTEITPVPIPTGMLLWPLDSKSSVQIQNNAYRPPSAQSTSNGSDRIRAKGYLISNLSHPMRSDDTGFSSTPSRPSNGDAATTMRECSSTNSGWVPQSLKVDTERPYAKRRQAQNRWGDLYRHRSEDDARPRTDTDFWRRETPTCNCTGAATPPAKLMAAEVARYPDAALERPTDVRAPTNHQLDGGGSDFYLWAPGVWCLRLRD